MRDVLVQMLQRRLLNADAASLFPDFTPSTPPELFLQKL
jgi:hypothetical protein